MTVVLDASAVLAALLGEPGGGEVESALDDAVICTVNLAEVAAALVRHGNSAVQARALIAALDCPGVPADVELALDAGLLRPLTDRAGLSLGDRFCVALARRLNCPILTADRSWAAIAEPCGIEVELIR